jgi:hypothetical protein
MKISAAAVLFLTAQSVSAQATIYAKCAGVDFNQLSVAEHIAASYALEDAYNKVHGSSGTDDSELSNVSYRAGSSTGDWGCRLCPNDDDSAAVHGAWTGDWGCRLCPNDDDAAAFATLGASGAALKAWENEFVAGLVNSNHASFKDLKACDIEVAPEEPEEPTVDIQVKCDGANLNKLYPAEATLVAKALQSTYNKIHSGAGNDSELQNVAHKTGDWGCRLCPNDDTAVASHGSWTGDWGCRLCPNDDDAITSNIALQVWERELFLTLKDSSHFKHVGKCYIDMVNTAAEVEEPSTENVNLEVNCKGVDFSKLSAAEYTAVGLMLEGTYEKVRGKTGTGDSQLTNIMYTTTGDWGCRLCPNDDDATALHGTWTGDWGCRLCPNDDDASAFFAVGGTGAALKAWENEFEAALQESNHAPFVKAGQCLIRMAAPLQATKKSSLRKRID